MQAGETPPDRRPAHHAKLVQDRSVATRKKILQAALSLWSSRGFVECYESSTVEEIASYAKTSRATVYYYFKKKEDILRELGRVTANDIYEYALRAIEHPKSVDEMLDDVVCELARKLTAYDPAAMRLVVQLTSDHEAIVRDRATGVMRAFSLVMEHAQQAGTLQTPLSPLELADILAGLCTSCCMRWSRALESDLTTSLRKMVAFVLAGARALDQPPTRSAKA
jgi:AcrR family transcriptional regulator